MERIRVITETSRKIEGIKKIDAYQGEIIEDKVKRMTENKEPIKDGAPLVYTEKNEGVKPEHNIRTDKWAIVQEKMDAANKQKFLKSKGFEPQKNETENETESETKTETPTDMNNNPST